MSNKTKKTIYLILIILVALSFFYSRIARNIETVNIKENNKEEVEEVKNEEKNTNDIKEEQGSISIELERPPFIK